MALTLGAIDENPRHAMRDRRLNILFLSPCWPVDRSYGGQLRALHTARALKQIGTVTLVVVNSDALDEEAMRKSAGEFEIQPPIHLQLSPKPNFFQKIRRAVDAKHMDVHGLAASAADRERIYSCFLKYDLLWILNSRTPNLLQLWRWPHAHLDVDDVPSTYFRAVSRNGIGAAERWKARVQGALMKRRELLFAKRFTTLSVCSEEDRRYLGAGSQIHVVPNGFERPASVPNPSPSAGPPRIGFIGLYSYAPNLDGMQWFFSESWPIVRKALPGVRFRLIGKDSDGPLKPIEPDVDVLGWVTDPAAEIATWSAMVIPIRIGGGTRIKIADAFSRKCPVVSTRFGALGYGVEEGKQLRLADTPRDFARMR